MFKTKSKIDRFQRLAVGILAICLSITAYHVSTTDPHDHPMEGVSALHFLGTVITNDKTHGRFTFRNLSNDPLAPIIDWIEIGPRQSREIYAANSPQGTLLFIKEFNDDFKKHIIGKDESIEFLIPNPHRGDQWRLRIGVFKQKKDTGLTHRLGRLIRSRQIRSFFQSGTNIVGSSRIGKIMSADIDNTEQIFSEE